MELLAYCHNRNCPQEDPWTVSYGVLAEGVHEAVEPGADRCPLCGVGGVLAQKRVILPDEVRIDAPPPPKTEPPAPDRDIPPDQAPPKPLKVATNGGKPRRARKPKSDG